MAGYGQRSSNGSPTVAALALFLLLAGLLLHEVYLSHKVARVESELVQAQSQLHRLAREGSEARENAEQALSAVAPLKNQVAAQAKALAELSAATSQHSHALGQQEGLLMRMSLPPAPAVPPPPAPPPLELEAVRKEMLDHIQTVTFTCKSKQLVGGEEDVESGRIVGAWPVCLDDGLLSQPCVVYLFSTSGRPPGPADAWFAHRHCQVHNFDAARPEKLGGRVDRELTLHSEGLGGMNGVVRGLVGHYAAEARKYWSIKTLRQVVKDLGHQHRRISYMQFDIDGGEWDALHNMLASGSIEKVDQMAGTVHLWAGSHQTEEQMAVAMAGWLKLLRRVHDLGFELFHFEALGGATLSRGEGEEGAGAGDSTAGKCCFELAWVRRGAGAAGGGGTVAVGDRADKK